MKRQGWEKKTAHQLTRKRNKPITKRRGPEWNGAKNKTISGRDIGTKKNPTKERSWTYAKKKANKISMGTGKK